MHLHLLALPDEVIARIAHMLSLCDSVASLSRTCKALRRCVAVEMPCVVRLTACPSMSFWESYRLRIENITLDDASELPPIVSHELKSLTVRAKRSSSPLFGSQSLTALTTVSVPASELKTVPVRQLQELELTDCKSVGLQQIRAAFSDSVNWLALKRLRLSRPAAGAIDAVCESMLPSAIAAGLTSLKIGRAFDTESNSFWQHIQATFSHLTELSVEGCIISDCTSATRAWSSTLTSLTILDTTLGDATLNGLVRGLRSLRTLILCSSKFTCKAVLAFVCDTRCCPRLETLVVDSVVACLLTSRSEYIRARRPVFNWREI